MGSAGAPIGREGEVEVLRDFLEDAAAFPDILQIEGDAGIGKTTLWRCGLELAVAHSYRVLSCSPSGAETQLSFAGLGDMLETVTDEVLSDLPPPLARALSIALLLEDAAPSPPDQRAIGLALLGGIRALARDGPLVIAVDDVQWLDDASGLTLGFALRRISEEPVGVLLARRTGGEEGPSGPGLELGPLRDRDQRLVMEPLSMGAIHHLLGERLGLTLTRPNARRLYEVSGGNPFYALELGRAVVRGAIDLEPGGPLPRSLSSLVADRIASTSEPTRHALLIVSALSHPTMDLIARAGVEAPTERLAPALETHVIEFENERIRFSHPLLAAGVYSAAVPLERRAVHQRLADVVTDPEEQARHVALGAEGPDPATAAVLEDAAVRTHARGALAAAAGHAAQAWRLTPHDRRHDRIERAILAVAYAFEIGDSTRAGTLLDETLGTTLPGPQRARALYWLGALQDYEGDRRRAIEFFQEALDEPEVGLALRAQLEAGIADSLFLLREELPRAARHAASAVESSERIGDVATQVAALAIDGLVDAVLGGHRWRETLPHAMSLEGEASSTRLAFTASFAFALTLTWADEFDEARTIFTSLRGLADERGEGSALPWILANLSLVEYLSGRWDEALRATEDAIDVSLQTRQEPQRLFALGVRALVGCSRGDEGARNDAESVLEGAERHGVMIATILAASGLGLLELAQDGHAETHRILEPVGSRLEAGGVREPGSMRFVADDIEALIGLDRRDEAEARLADLERRAQHLDRASALAAAARCRGLLKAAGGDVDGAIASFREALDQHARVTDPFERARTLLALGSAYRREKRKREARETLEEALTSFGTLGARPWVERARSGLARIGGRTSTGGELTPTERRVAILVAEGLANKEVAAKLFVTVKTVEANLTRVYAKLGVRSRTELALRLTGPDPRVGTGKP